MRRGVRIPAWYLLLVAVLGILSRCQSLRDLERFAIRHHGVLTEALGLELRRPPSDSAFRYFFRQVDVAALCAAIRDWTIAQIPGGTADLDQLVCDGKMLRTAALNLLRLTGFQSIRAGMQAVMHDITALLAMAMKQPEPSPD
ncbi:MAG: transposase family protein [Cyanobacteriota bacterium]